MTDEPRKTYRITIHIENREMLSGYDKIEFHATDWLLEDGCLTFAIPGGSGKVFNWSRVLYFDAVTEGDV